MKKVNKDPALAERNRKIAESHRLRTLVGKQFAIGDMVQQKYYPKSVGLVMSKPVIVRDSKTYNLVPEAHIDILWITHAYLTDGQVTRMSSRYLSRKEST